MIISILRVRKPRRTQLTNLPRSQVGGEVGLHPESDFRARCVGYSATLHLQYTQEGDPGKTTERAQMRTLRCSMFGSGGKMFLGLKCVHQPSVALQQRAEAGSVMAGREMDK